MYVVLYVYLSVVTAVVLVSDMRANMCIANVGFIEKCTSVRSVCGLWRVRQGERSGPVK